MFELQGIMCYNDVLKISVVEWFTIVKYRSPVFA